VTVAKILKSKGNDEVVTISAERSVTEAAQMLAEKRIGSLVVSDDGKLPLGILSERDIVRELGRRGPGCLSERVEQMMTTRLVTCTRADKADDVLATMTSGRFRHMPVVEEGVMVGLITLGDVVKYRLEELEMEKGALQGMIMGY